MWTFGFDCARPFCLDIVVAFLFFIFCFFFAIFLSLVVISSTVCTIMGLRRAWRVRILGSQYRMSSPACADSARCFFFGAHDELTSDLDAVLFQRPRMTRKSKHDSGVYFSFLFFSSSH